MTTEQASAVTDGSRENAVALVRTEQAGLGVHGKWKGFDIRATGLYAGAFVCGVVVTVFLVWLEPVNNPQHFLLAMLACFVAGIFTSAGMAYGRLQDALKSRDDFREEMNKIAERSQELERIILRNRLSSTTSLKTVTDQKNTKGKRT